MTDHGVLVKVHSLIVQVRVWEGFGSNLGQVCCSDLPLSHSTVTFRRQPLPAQKICKGGGRRLGKEPLSTGSKYVMQPQCGLDQKVLAPKTYIPDPKMAVERQGSAKRYNSESLLIFYAIVL